MYSHLLHTFFQAGEDMIKTAAQSSRLALSKTRAGWLLTSAVISLGSPYIRHNVSRLMLLWKCSFPRSVNEAKAEEVSALLCGCACV